MGAFIHAVDATKRAPQNRDRSNFVSEPTVYHVLKTHDLITSPAFIVFKSVNEFKDKTIRINQLWQTDFNYIKVLCWGWFYLSTGSTTTAAASLPGSFAPTFGLKT